MALPTKKSSLPPQWVSEIENVENAPQNTDGNLDAFLERFQTEIVAARQLKNRLGSCPREDYAQLKTDFKDKMTNVWKLFSNEGEQYVQSLDVGEAEGNDTDELQRGIERLESAVKNEESKRNEKRVELDKVASSVTPEDRTLVEKPDRDVGKMHMKPEKIACTINSDETLQLMRSDIQALKLELVKLQRSKANENVDVTTDPNPSTIQSTAPTTATFTSPELGRLNTNVSVVRVTGRANIAPKHINHLELMKSRLEALEKKPVARRAKSAARLGRTHTIGSMYDDATKTVMTYGTPPGARMKHRSISTQSPVMDKTPVEVRLRAMSSAASTPSPERGGDNAARMLFDAPEEMLQRPQSYAAAKDMQRYSIKVARRLGVDNGRGSIEARARSAVTTGQNTGSKPVQAPSTPHAASDIAPSTMDTSGSGGRVVEEIEGDMWVRKGVMWKRWRRRYASIVSHQFFGKVLCLFCYDGQGGVMSKRSQIVVLNGSVCRAERERAEFGKERGKFVFALRTRSKEYLFAADSDEMRWNWIRELRDAARVGRGRSMAFRK